MWLLVELCAALDGFYIVLCAWVRASAVGLLSLSDYSCRVLAAFCGSALGVVAYESIAWLTLWLRSTHVVVHVWGSVSGIGWCTNHVVGRVGGGGCQAVVFMGRAHAGSCALGLCLGECCPFNCSI